MLRQLSKKDNIAKAVFRLLQKSAAPLIDRADCMDKLSTCSTQGCPPLAVDMTLIVMMMMMVMLVMMLIAKIALAMMQGRLKHII